MQNSPLEWPTMAYKGICLRLFCRLSNRQQARSEVCGDCVVNVLTEQICHSRARAPANVYYVLSRWLRTPNTYGGTKQKEAVISTRYNRGNRQSNCNSSALPAEQLFYRTRVLKSEIVQMWIFCKSQSPHNSQKCIKKYLDNASTLCIDPIEQQKHPYLPAETLFAAIVKSFHMFFILHNLAAILYIHIVSPHLTNTIRSHYWNAVNLHNSYTFSRSLSGKVFHVQGHTGQASPHQQTQEVRLYHGEA